MNILIIGGALALIAAGVPPFIALIAAFIAPFIASAIVSKDEQ